jgi:hypothetical protein
LTGITSIDGSAAKLTTARTIGGTSFDGTANIKIGALSSTNVDATTSAQFAGVLSDEVGFSAGALSVFNINPALVGFTATGNGLFNDNIQGIWGTGSDLKIYHDGTANQIQSVAADLLIGNSSTTSEFMRMYYNGGVGYLDLKYNGTTVASTANGGFSIASGQALMYNSADMIIASGSAQTYGSIKYEGTTMSTAGVFNGSTTTPTGTTRLNYNGYLYATKLFIGGSEVAITAPGGSASEVQYRSSATAFGGFAGVSYLSGNMLFSDNIQALFGTGSDMKIYHDGTSNHIQSVGCDLLIGNSSTTSEFIRLYNNSGVGYVSLRYDGSEVFTTTSTGVNIASGKNYYLNGSKYNLDASTAGTTKATWDADDVLGASRAATSAYVAANSGGTPGGSTYDLQYKSGTSTFGGISSVSTDGTSLICKDGANLYIGTDKDFGIGYFYSTVPEIMMGGSGIDRFSLLISSTNILTADYSGAGGLDHYIQIGESGSAHLSLNLTDGTTTTLNLTVGGYSTATDYISAGTYINAATGYKFNGTSGATVTKTVGSDQVVVQGGIITSWATPPLSPAPKLDQPEQTGISTTEHITEYSPDFRQIRLVTKVYTDGILTEKIPGQWKNLNHTQQKLIKGL